MLLLCPEMFHCLQSSRALSEWRVSGRYAMKMFPAHPILWSSLLVLFALQIEADISDVCEDTMSSDNIDAQSTSVQGHEVEREHIHDKDPTCVLYPTNILNCSWSFNTVQQDTQLFVNISICAGNKSVQSPDLSSEEKVGSRSLALHDHKMSHLILHFNFTLGDNWTVYVSKYDLNMLEVLSPPQNISASIKDGGLLVTWGLPHSRAKPEPEPDCFEYQLDMGDQLLYPLLDLFHSVDIQPQSGLKTSVVPQLSKVLFPPIPRPPQKYKHFLQTNDSFNFFHPTQSAEPAEEITEVEDMEQTPGKTL
ncbi:hypothetical protein JOQ06_012736 [Pogonophryne albipinna]|uniref:Uncharacterized protein n=1 Tax=Pogonophryne albipinna TaxID=1090488 RepID=A0AAD6BJU8_9TELE|nr:hypothetical protein JOQ06_012736 [Pogonophryne albipinna]